ncbi:unnamed protein product [Plutella xylostella]|uniref:(diamondback moth) hypothetical protein n=1 Tax=Plutella xylostella TaxID=51655 RepID=A0A8S4G8Y1_PLUXY|nr:unnamed protein product [Plutella xylostella]
MKLFICAVLLIASAHAGRDKRGIYGEPGGLLSPSLSYSPVISPSYISSPIISSPVLSSPIIRAPVYAPSSVLIFSVLITGDKVLSVLASTQGSSSVLGSCHQVSSGIAPLRFGVVVKRLSDDEIYFWTTADWNC